MGTKRTASNCSNTNLIPAGSSTSSWRNRMSIAIRVLGIVALATFATQVLGEDDFPIVGTYTENTPCTGDGPTATRVTITAHEIDSAFGLCARSSKCTRA